MSFPETPSVNSQEEILKRSPLLKTFLVYPLFEKGNYDEWELFLSNQTNTLRARIKAQLGDAGYLTTRILPGVIVGAMNILRSDQGIEKLLERVEQLVLMGYEIKNAGDVKAVSGRVTNRLAGAFCLNFDIDTTSAGIVNPSFANSVHRVVYGVLLSGTMLHTVSRENLGVFREFINEIDFDKPIGNDPPDSVDK